MPDASIQQFFGIGGHNHRARRDRELTFSHSFPANTHSVNGLHTELRRLASPSPLGHNGPMQTGSTHGHALLNHIIDNGGRVDLSQLRQWALTTHGKDAHYHTCSIDGLSLDGILQFFQERHKVSVNGMTVSVNVENVCAHGDTPHTDHE